MQKGKVNYRLVKILAYVMAFLLTITTGGYLLLPLGGVGVLMWIIISAFALFLLVRWHISSLLYYCHECGKTFVVSGFVDIFTPYEATATEMQQKTEAWKYSWCPYCKKNTKSSISRRC